MATTQAERRHMGERRGMVERDWSSPMSALDWLVVSLLIVGGINWGLVGLLDLDLVAVAAGQQTMLARVAYGLIGLAALLAIYTASKMAGARKPVRHSG